MPPKPRRGEGPPPGQGEPTAEPITLKFDLRSRTVTSSPTQQASQRLEQLELNSNPATGNPQHLSSPTDMEGVNTERTPAPEGVTAEGPSPADNGTASTPVNDEEQKGNNANKDPKTKTAHLRNRYRRLNHVSSTCGLCQKSDHATATHVARLSYEERLDAVDSGLICPFCCRSHKADNCYLKDLLCSACGGKQCHNKLICPIFATKEKKLEKPATN